MNQVTQYHYDRLNHLKGGLITDILVDEANDGTFIGFIVRKMGGIQYQVISLADPEGNGPGALEIIKLGTKEVL